MNFLFPEYQNQTDCSHGSVRLTHRSHEGTEGQVQICNEGIWQSVCSTGLFWSQNAASVVCRQLGFSGEGTSKPYLLTYTLNILTYPLGVLTYPLGVLTYPLGVLTYPLGVLTYPLDVLTYPLSVLTYPLSALTYLLKLLLFYLSAFDISTCVLTCLSLRQSSLPTQEQLHFPNPYLLQLVKYSRSISTALVTRTTFLIAYHLRVHGVDVKSCLATTVVMLVSCAQVCRETLINCVAVKAFPLHVQLLLELS